MPVRAKKMRQIEDQNLGSDSIRTDQAPEPESAAQAIFA
jgi:hypothetical protein